MIGDSFAKRKANFLPFFSHARKNGFLFGNTDYDDLADRLADVMMNTKLRIAVSQCVRPSIAQKASP